MPKLVWGFTLIELLVVIAIIGILAQVVISSINGAKAKAANASIKSDLQGIRSQASIIYDNFQGYLTVCTDRKVTEAITDAINAGKDISGTIANRCNSDNDAWAVNILLKAPEGLNNYWCVDSTGSARGEANELNGATVCS